MSAAVASPRAQSERLPTGAIVVLSLGAVAAFAIIDGARLAAGFPAEDGFTSAFGMRAAGAGVALLASAFVPGRAARVAS